MTEADWFAATDPAPLLRYVESRFTDRLRLLFMAGCCRRIWDLLTDERFRRVVETAEDVAEGKATELELQAASEELPRPGYQPPPPPALEPIVRQNWVTGAWPVRIGRGLPLIGGLQPGTYTANFNELPSWVQQTYHAVAGIAQRGYLIVAERCENAAAHHAGDAVAEQHPLHREIQQLRDEVQKAHRRVDELQFRGARTLQEEAVAAAQRLERETDKKVQALDNEIWSAGRGERISRAAVERAAQTDLVRCLVGNPFREVAVDPSWLTSTVVALARGIDVDRAYDRLPILADALEDAGCADANVLSHCRGAHAHTKGCWVIELLDR
jgi:hypothetical protein